ncbi:hypothetical protein PEPS_18900 [Persicobacter psychrovividus]|uniref:Uncharacterized protein n=1 Tax=Persicobacter psychrovividus TaxID=387638 RepID=A0ABN6L8U9_9BACT|nr:hypothetical protein PEPS_18900 [Persicobacter psychrovividus]
MIIIIQKITYRHITFGLKINTNENQSYYRPYYLPYFICF